MLSRETRGAILELKRRGLGSRAIARTLGVSRGAVRQVLGSGQTTPPPAQRAQRAEPYRQQILELLGSCKGNLVRVHEELVRLGLELSYPALTAFCRREGIGQAPKRAAGSYDFVPGHELQHDTSPHTAEIGGRKCLVQSVAATLAYSGMLFFQGYSSFKRLHCKSFLTESFRYLQGVTAQVMVDNTRVIALRGAGATMVPVPEMAAFAGRLGFVFRAHELGDVNRSARVERPFSFIEGNFYAGRRFTDFDDLNAQAREWCDRVNQRYVRTRRAVPSELFAVERLHLAPLPAWLPDPYELCRRSVDVEGYVCLDTNRYSVPEAWIGDPVEVRATLRQITIEHRRFGAIEHRRLVEHRGQRILLPEHRRTRQHRPAPTEREMTLVATRAPELVDYARDLAEKGRKQPTLALRRLLAMLRDFPREPLVAAVREAHHYGLFDLDRLETMVLRRIAKHFFRFDEDPES